MHCKDCKFWGGHYLKGENRVSTCDFVEYDIPKKDKDKGIYLLISADDDQGLNVSLETGENFGCIQFQPKK